MKIAINESFLKSIVSESVKRVLNEISSTPTLDEREQFSFGDYFSRSKKYCSNKGRKYGFELRKNGEWKYGDIEYDPNTQTMSCMGVCIHVQPQMTILDAEEDLFEALLNAGYDTGF